MRGRGKERTQLTSVTSTRDFQWAVSLAMTCPIEMQQAAKVFNNAGLRATHTKAPPPQLVNTSRNPATYEKIADELYKVLKSAGHKEDTSPGMFLRIIRGGTPGR